MKQLEKGKDVDYEWVKLIVEAKEIGLTAEEVRMYLTETHEK